MPAVVVEDGAARTEKFIDSIDPDDPEYVRQIIRPAEIKEDLNLMEQRQRVSRVLKSEAFRKELEDVIETFNRSNDSTGLNCSLLSLQHLTELLSVAPGKRPLTGGGFSKGGQSGVIPINDLRGVDASYYSRRERLLRCKLASVYRLIDLFGWNTSIYNHATVRLSRNEEHFLINPFGLLYHEITASSLIKLDSQGQIIDPGSTVLGVHQTGWLLHSAVHSARPDIRCVIHLGTPAAIAVSCMKSGLLPLSQEAIILGDVGYYNGTPALSIEHAGDGGSAAAVDVSAERAAISEALGPDTHILFVRCRGLLALGDTIEEAWHYATNAVRACETQLRLASLGTENLVLPPANVRQRAYEAWRTSEMGGVSGPQAALAIRIASARSASPNRKDGYLSDSSIGPAGGAGCMRPWRLGELEFEALMRHLDNGGYRTGHLYRREPHSSPERSRRTLDRSGACSPGVRHYDDVEVPPFASSAAATIAQFYDEGAFSGDESEAPRPGTLRRQWSDHPWFNTPNSYTKEVSTLPGRQPVAHWVSSREATLQSQITSGSRLPPPTPFRPLTPAAIPLGSTGGQSSTPSAPTSYNRFAPQGANPKELKEQQKKLKAKYYHDTNTAGPQSRLLDGLTWDEARRIRDDALGKALGPGAVSASISPTSQPTVAAASKAILQRDVRDAAIVYDGVYVKQNPFGQVTDEELEAYKKEIELKSNPALYAEWLSSQKALETPSKQAQVSASTTEVESRLSPPPTAGAATSEASEVEESAVSDKKAKKKRRFKLLSFPRKSRAKEKKGGS
ncbi:Adducin 3 (Gamma) [Sparganum proliferum]